MRPQAASGGAAAPDAVGGRDGRPLFTLHFTREDLADPGLRSLYVRESRYGGYEYGVRRFFVEHLEPGDTFIDVGAHRGLYCLTAALLHPGRVTVWAVEPHPDNLRGLAAQLRANGCEKAVQVFPVALADRPGTARLFANSSMGHRLPLPGESLPPAGSRPGPEVPVSTLDGLVRAAGLPVRGRVFLKIDVGGLEPQVLEGAAELLLSGRVAAVAFEKGTAFASDGPKSRLLRALDRLRDLCLDAYRFADDDLGGVLTPFVPGKDCCTVLALDRSLARRAVYPKPFGPRLARPEALRPAMTAAESVLFTRALMAAGATDPARWTEVAALASGAERRACAAAPLVPAGSSVLDLGAGLMLLSRYLAPNCRYLPADVVARSRDCLVLDLNQGQFPEGSWDVICCLGLLEHLHDPAALLARLAPRCRRLILTVRPRERMPVRRRRALGFFHDLTLAETLELLARTGFEVQGMEDLGGEFLLVCRPRTAQEGA